MMIELNREQQIALLKLARKTIADALDVGEDLGEIDLKDGVFRQKCGAFVTLHTRGRLRGCIGYIQGVKDIPETVTEMALSSAFKDPRFRPLRAMEYPDIDIEISVLSPIEDVTDVSEIQVGRDGIIICRGYHQGLLLPQVATEQCWDLDTFLSHTCLKAGIHPDSWKDKATKIQKFSAVVFSEKELGLL
ncbi:MAG: AmmeMemoRadiSam system protein A [Spirochaetes bacterium]|nr:AmmeMemoRadiSam system protein A [Spirochaetota bacterium]